MDLDSDYYSSSSRCKDIIGLWMFKGNFSDILGWENDH